MIFMHIITGVLFEERFIYLCRIKKGQSDRGDVRKYTCTPTVCLRLLECLLLTTDKLQLAMMLDEKIMKADSMLRYMYRYT